MLAQNSMRKLTVREVVQKVLNEKNKPLSINEILNYIIEEDLYQFNTESPLNIVKVSVRRHTVGVNFLSARSDKYFQILLDGKYWLKDIPVPGQSKESQKAIDLVRKDFENLKITFEELNQIHSKHNIVFKKNILNQLKQIDPKTFELFSKKFLEAYGFRKMQVTNYVKDGGIDGHGQLKVGLTHLNVAFQCKRWGNKTIGRSEIDKFRGAIQGDFEQGIFFTTTIFSKEALKATRKNGAVPIILIDGMTMIDFMIEKQFGVDVEVIPVYINALDKVWME